MADVALPFDFVGGHWLGIILGIVLAEYMGRRSGRTGGSS